MYDGLAEPLVLKPEQKLTARLTFFRLHGSHGEILLSVTEPCPCTTCSFSPAVVHSGAPHVDMVISADGDAPLVSHFPADCCGTETGDGRASSTGGDGAGYDGGDDGGGERGYRDLGPGRGLSIRGGR